MAFWKRVLLEKDALEKRKEKIMGEQKPNRERKSSGEQKSSWERKSSGEWKSSWEQKSLWEKKSSVEQKSSGEQKSSEEQKSSKEQKSSEERKSSGEQKSKKTFVTHPDNMGKICFGLTGNFEIFLNFFEKILKCVSGASVSDSKIQDIQEGLSLD